MFGGSPGRNLNSKSMLFVVINVIQALTYSFAFKFDVQTHCFCFPMAAATYNKQNNKSINQLGGGTPCA